MAKIFQRRSEKEIPKQALEIVKLLEFPIQGKIVDNVTFLFGSFLQKIQPYYGDIDTLMTVVINAGKDEAKMIFLKTFLEKINILSQIPNLYITDVKAGVYADGEAVHWTVSELFQGFRNGGIPDFNGHLGDKKLIDALGEQGLFKLDIVVPYFGKYLEATAVYFLKTPEGWVGLDQDYYADPKRVLPSLKENAKKQLEHGKLYKTFKRIFAQVRVLGDTATAEKMIPLLRSSVALISLINGDLSTLDLVLQTHGKVDREILYSELENMRDKLAGVVDIKLESDKIDKLISGIEESTTNDRMRYLIQMLQGMLLETVNTATGLYLKKIGWSTIPPKYL